MTMTATENTRMFIEAAEAGDVVARQLALNAETSAALGDALREHPPRVVVTCARGSSDHAATFAKYLIETRARVLTTSAAPSIASVYGTPPSFKDTLAIGISQSGKSPDIVATLAAAKEGGARTAALVNVVDSPLAALADTVLPLSAGPETSVAATKSFIATLSAVTALVASWTRDEALAASLADLPRVLRLAFACDWSAMVDALAPARGLYVIGRGLSLGVAQEAALKFKETCGLHAEAFSAAEVKHGPMALVGRDFPLLVFRQDDETAAGTDALVAEVVGRSGTVLLVGGSVPGAITLPLPAADAALQPIVAIQAFYRAVNALSVRRGFDPDRPPHLAKVTETV
jgi:glucosamine--fructose-6-phosphate aminotransferase (isomerizing)